MRESPPVNGKIMDCRGQKLLGKCPNRGLFEQAVSVGLTPLPQLPLPGFGDAGTNLWNQPGRARLRLVDLAAIESPGRALRLAAACTSVTIRNNPGISKVEPLLSEPTSRIGETGSQGENVLGSTARPGGSREVAIEIVRVRRLALCKKTKKQSKFPIRRGRKRKLRRVRSFRSFARRRPPSCRRSAGRGRKRLLGRLPPVAIGGGGCRRFSNMSGSGRVRKQ